MTLAEGDAMTTAPPNPDVASTRLRVRSGIRAGFPHIIPTVVELPTAK
jgi:hypothetical protein